VVEFEPKIIGFLCNWCSYAGADLAGVSRIQYPPNVRVIRVMCSGRVDSVIVLEMFANGADGVLVTGCHPGDCHYLEGNLYAERRIKMLKKLMACAGLEPERLRLEWVSAAEGARFADIVKDFTIQLKGLGPSSLAQEKVEFGSSVLESEKAKSKLLVNVLAAENAASDFRLRVLVGRERELTEDVNVYGEKISQEEFDALMDEIVKEEFVRHKIYLLTKTKPLSAKALAEAVELKPAAVLRQIVDMRRRNMIALDHIEGTTPFYKALEVE
jgi:F420-non-reducing hydrogenase iron-sulfur subunit